MITGYAVCQRMSVLVRSLPDSGDAISAAAAAGGNAIRSTSRRPPPTTAAALSAVPIRAGSADLNVSVSVVWALEPAAQE